MKDKKMNNEETQKTMQKLDNERTALFDLMITMSKRGDDFTHVSQAWKVLLMLKRIAKRQKKIYVGKLIKKYTKKC